MTVTEATSVGRRRAAWVFWALCNVASWWLPFASRQRVSYWLIGIATSVALVPMLYRDVPTTGARAWVPVVLAAALTAAAIALLF